MKSSNGTPERPRGTAFSLRIRRRRRKTRRRAPVVPPPVAGAEPPGSSAPASLRQWGAAFLGKLWRAGGSRRWGIAAIVALAVAFGLGRASRAPEPRPPAEAGGVPTAGPARLPPSLAAPDPEPAPPAVFLDRPAEVGLPEPGAHEVLCITKPGRSARQSIQQLGGRRQDGAPWRLDRDRAIAGVKAGVWSFHVGSGAAAADVLVDVSRTGNEILKTRPDRRVDNNLLSLPECP